MCAKNYYFCAKNFMEHVCGWITNRSGRTYSIYLLYYYKTTNTQHNEMLGSQGSMVQWVRESMLEYLLPAATLDSPEAVEFIARVSKVVLGVLALLVQKYKY